MTNTTAIGLRAQARAVDHLENQGYEILAENWRTRFCELDIIARNKYYLVFVEVKFRRTSDFGGGVGAITADKLQRLTRAAESWLAEHQEFDRIQPRIDVIEVVGRQLQHFRNCS